ncbi:MAG: EthD family reductase [Candidatus Binatia bacterium]
MYCVKILYPNRPGSSFNLQHYFDVHIPLGLRLMKEHCDLVPARLEVDTRPSGMTADSKVPYHAISSIYFEQRAEADACRAFFGREEIFRELSRDFPNYTESDPEIIFSELVAIDPSSFKPL